MTEKKKCCCGYASLAAIIVIFIITYISGYTMGNWTATTWLAILVILFTSTFCLLCRQKEDD